MIDYRAYPVLYVDDERANLVAVRYALDGMFELLTASNGEEALRLLAENSAIAVLLCDQRMPGMDGVSVCEAARRVRPDAIRIMISAYADLHAAIDAINRGQVSRYVRKPFQNEDLVEILRTAIELVHIQRTLQDMEVRLLRVGQNPSGAAVEADVTDELARLVGELRLKAERSSALAGAAALSLDESPPRPREILDEIAEVANDTSSLARQLEDLVERLRQAEAESSPDAYCFVDRVVESTTGILRPEVQRVARLRVISESSPRVRMDPSVLGQVLTNLLLNAAQALHGRSRDDASITVHVAEQNGRALLTVSDDGPSVPPELAALVLDSSVSGTDGGSGLGLTVVREMVARAGGTVNVASSAGGTTFTVDLPLRQSTSPPPPR